MDIQWYPGHMTKARRQMQEDMKLIDIVIEILDARAPLSSRNPDINKIAGSKKRLVILNKADMADKNATKQWKRYYEARGIFAEAVDARSKTALSAITPTIMKACAEKLPPPLLTVFSSRAMLLRLLGATSAVLVPAVL